MKVLLITLALWMSAAQAFAEPIRPWWVEGAFASADLAPLSRPCAQPAALPERLPSVLTLIQRAADLHGVDADLLRALVALESAYDPGAVSEDGAIGLGQLMPVVANWCGVTNRFHRVQNIDCAARHLRVLLSKYSGDERLALAAYNAGEPAVDRCRCVPSYPETEDYVARVLVLRSASSGDAS